MIPPAVLTAYGFAGPYDTHRLGGTRNADFYVRCQESGSLPFTLNHGDVHPGNLMMAPCPLPESSDGDMDACEALVTAFVDLDWLCHHPVIYDLACAVLFIATDRPGPIADSDIWSLTQPFAYNAEKLALFLKEYVANVPPQLLGEGLAQLDQQMRLTWAHCRLDGARKVPVEQRKAFLERDLATPFAWLDAQHAWLRELARLPAN